MKKNKGITIIALIVSIIILIILAGVSIATINGDNGIVIKASKAKFISEVREIEEALELAEIEENKGENFKFGKLENYINVKDEYNQILSLEDEKLVYDKEKVSEKQAKWLEEINIYEKKNIIPIYTDIQLAKIGTDEEIEIDGTSYKFSMNATYYLQNDIDISGTVDEQWNCIGNETTPFEGVVDGQNHTIKGIYISNEEINQGLFGVLDGTVRNLNIKESYINSNAFRAYIGAIAGKMNSNGQIVNCVNEATVQSTNSVGGLIGENHGLISKCVNKGDIIGIYADVGGITGDNSGTVVQCVNIGEISTGTGCRGGIAGLNGNIVKECYNKGGTGNAGIVGVNDTEQSIIESCYNEGLAIHAGICTQNRGTIVNCYNVSQIKGVDTWSAGIVANNEGITRNCYNIGKATNGIAGNNTGELQYCYYITDSSDKIQISSSTGTTENCAVKDEGEFYSDEFLTLLNTGNDEAVFVKDEKEINKGYPILEWQAE